MLAFSPQASTHSDFFLNSLRAPDLPTGALFLTIYCWSPVETIDFIGARSAKSGKIQQNPQTGRKHFLAEITLALALIAVILWLSGCGSATATVQAQSPTLALPTQPNSETCGATADGDGEACTFFHNIVDANGGALGYCQGESHYFPLTKTYSFSLEIGIDHLITDPNASGCNVPVPERMTLLNLRGNNSLIPFTGNQTTIVDWVYAVDAGHKASLFNGTLTAMHGNPIATALQGDAGENLAFASAHPADVIVVWFNLDLPGSAPATIKVTGAGDTQ